MKYLSVFISSLLLSGCLSVGGFQPPKPVDSWRLHNLTQYFDLTTKEGMIKYYKRKGQDMRACGIDPVFGDSLYAESSLCMESKGWYEKKGPVCETERFYNDPLCVKWRAKRKR